MHIWDITISAPTGSFGARLQIKDEDGAVSGEMSGKNGAGPMQNLVMTKDRLAWSTKIEKPMPMTLKFEGVIEGDALNGTVKFGLFASGRFEGQRVVAPVEKAS